MVETSTCYTCSASCYECVRSSYCLSCKTGKYLSKSSSSVTYGSCVSKSGSATFSIYVTSYVSPNSNTVQSITGSFTNPFNTIMDAVEKAYELGAPYFSATVYIYLIDSGDAHAMLRTNVDYYMSSSSDTMS
jgi:hypothetical protein